MLAYTHAARPVLLVVFTSTILAGCADGDDEAATERPAICAAFAMPEDRNPVQLTIVNVGTASIRIVDDCDEPGLRGVDGFSVDGVSLRTFANCADYVEGVTCYADCYGGQGFTIAPGDVYEFPWSGTVMYVPEGASGSDAWAQLPSSCHPGECLSGDSIQCHPLRAVPAGEHTLKIRYDLEASSGTGFGAVMGGKTHVTTFTTPTDEVVVELP